MNLDKLLAFKKVYEANSFQKASHDIGSFSSVVTRQIQKLEQEVGYKLLNRSKVGLTLTDAGEIIYELACDIATLQEEAIEKVNASKKEFEGDIKILTTQGSINTWLVDKASDFLLNNPKVKLDIVGLNDLIDLKNIQTEVVVGPLSENYDFLEKIFLRSYRLFLYASEPYLRKYGIPKDYEDLHDHKVISFAGGRGSSFGDVDWFLSEQKKMVKPALNINSSVGLLKAAEKNLGIVSLGDELVKEHGAKLVRVFPTEPGKIIDIFYMYHKKMNTLRRVRAFGEYLHQQLNG